MRWPSLQAKLFLVGIFNEVFLVENFSFITTQVDRVVTCNNDCGGFFKTMTKPTINVNYQNQQV